VNFTKVYLCFGFADITDDVEVDMGSSKKFKPLINYLGCCSRLHSHSSASHWLGTTDIHMAHVGKKVACSSAALYTLQAYIKMDLLRKVYFSIVYCHLHYAILIWGIANKTLVDSLEVNNRAICNVREIHMIKQLPIKDMFLSTYILEIKNIYKYELAKYIYKMCTQMLAIEITEEHEYTSNYHNFYTRQLDNKILIITG